MPLTDELWLNTAKHLFGIRFANRTAYKHYRFFGN